MRRATHLLLILGIFSGTLWAQEPSSSKAKTTRMIGVFGGRKLPFNIRGVRDVYPFWGGRYGHELWGTNPEVSFYSINARDVNFYTSSLSFTFADSFDSFTFLTLIGVDGHYYSGQVDGTKEPFKIAMGFHLGCSPVLEITDNLSLRVDFKFNFGPGWMLDVGAGFAFAY